MKKSRKPLVLLLTLALLSVALASCGTSTEETDTVDTSNRPEQTTAVSEPLSEADTELLPPVEKKNYNDQLFFKLSGSVSDGNDSREFFWVDKSDGSVVDEALYARQVKISEYLGVEIVASMTGTNHLQNYQEVMTAIRGKDGSVDMYFTNTYTGIPTMITGGYFRDLASVPDLNLDADYWNQSCMETLSLDGRYFLGYNDYCVPRAYVLAFNKDMMEQYSDSLECSVYDLVYDYKWTVDRMIALSKLVYIDKTGDGKTYDDTYGLTGKQWGPWCSFVQASDIKVIDLNEKGDYEISFYNEKYRDKTVALVEKMKDLASADCSWLCFREEGPVVLPLTSKRALMYMEKTVYLEEYLHHGLNFGVLPYPMFDEAQKDVGYRSLNTDGNLVLPSYMRNEEMTAQTLEMLAFYAEPVQIAVFEKLLGKQVADTPDDSAMLDIVWDGLCADFIMTFSHADGSLDTVKFMLPYLTNPNGTDQIASFAARYEKSGNKGLEKFMKALRNYLSEME